MCPIVLHFDNAIVRYTYSHTNTLALNGTVGHVRNLQLRLMALIIRLSTCVYTLTNSARAVDTDITISKHGRGQHRENLVIVTKEK